LSITRLMKETQTASNLQVFGRRAKEARGDRGIRTVADEIGVSPATLSRVERGLMPDLETFGKICRWLKVDPAAILGVTEVAAKRPAVAVHFRKDRELKPTTAQALAEMILAAQRAFMVEEEDRAAKGV
jgi:transcriptional regulator with XRE-family HTH domain